jgi:PAS domain S-box-containing protein
MHASIESRLPLKGSFAEAVLWEADAATLQFTYISPDAEELFGYPLERWLTDANVWIDLLHPLDRDRAVQECRAAIDAGHDHVIEYRVRTARGKVIWIRDLVRVVVDAEGRPQSLHGAMVDITDRRLLLDQVRYAHRVQALGELTRAIAPTPNETIDLNMELRALEGTLRQLLGITIQVEMTLGAMAPQVRLPRAVLEQIVLTLVLNARDAMPAGGVLRLLTFDAPRIERVGIPAEPAQVVLEIEDTGSGMPRDVRARLFEPYFSTKGPKGTGMGLSLVDRFVAEANGHIEWSSHIGQGTRFRIFLPLAR